MCVFFDHHHQQINIMSFFSSLVGINSAMNIAKMILVFGLLLLSITSPTDQAIGLRHPDPIPKKNTPIPDPIPDPDPFLTSIRSL